MMNSVLAPKRHAIIVIFKNLLKHGLLLDARVVVGIKSHKQEAGLIWGGPLVRFMPERFAQLMARMWDVHGSRSLFVRCSAALLPAGQVHTKILQSLVLKCLKHGSVYRVTQRNPIPASFTVRFLQPRRGLSRRQTPGSTGVVRYCSLSNS